MEKTTSMAPIRTITSAEMRGINRSAILDLVRREGPLARSAISERLAVSLPTAMRIVDELIAEGLVIATGSKEWSGGRRRPLVAFNAAGTLMIGVDLGGTKMYGAVADLSGRILHEVTVTHHQTTGEESYTCLNEMITTLLKQASAAGQTVRGIGVGAPGITSYQEGVVQLAPSLDWVNFPLKERLGADFNLPVIVDNDVNLAALGELWFGSGNGANNLVVIAVGTGIGAGVVLEGAIYRGAHQAAGEIGYLVLNRSQFGRNYRDGFGACESLASGTGIAERGRLAWATAFGSDPAELTAEDIFAAAARQEPWAAGVVSETVDYLAQAVVAVVTCFDPDVIVLGGGVARSADLLIGPMLARLQKEIPVVPRVEASKLGYQATVLGAAVNLLHHTSDFYVVRKMT
jgi:glucokinase